MITFEEIELRGPELRDVKSLHRNIREAETNPLLANAYYPLSSLGVEEFLKKKADDAREEKGYLFSIYVEGEGPLGLLELANIDWKSRHLELRIWVSQGFQGRGYEKKAATAGLHFAFRELGMHKVYAKCLETDDVLRKLYEKAISFTEEGKLRGQTFHEGKYVGMLLFGMLEKEYNLLCGEKKVAIDTQKMTPRIVHREFKEGNKEPLY